MDIAIDENCESYGPLIVDAKHETPCGPIRFQVRLWGVDHKKRLLSWKGPHTHGMCFCRGTQTAANFINPGWKLWERDDNWMCRGESLEEILRQIKEASLVSTIGNLVTGINDYFTDDAYIELWLYVSDIIKNQKIDQFWL